MSGRLSGPSDLSAVVQPLSPFDPLEEDELLTAVVLTYSLTASPAWQEHSTHSAFPLRLPPGPARIGVKTLLATSL